MLALIPSAAMSADLEFQLGGTAFFNQLIVPNADQVPNDDLVGISTDDFTFGVDARLSFGIFQVSGIALITPPAFVDEGYYWDGTTWAYSAYAEPMQIELFASVGLKFDIAIFSLGFGLGPNFVFYIYPELPADLGGAGYYAGDTEVFNIGGHVKLFADINLGRLTVSLTYLMLVNGLNVADIAEAFEYMEGYIGVSVLYKM